jgi:hypothetical protein
MFVQLLLAILAQHLFLSVQFIERVRFEHDAFPVIAVLKSEEVPDFMGTFLGYPVNQVIVAPFATVILIAQPCGRNHRGTDRLAGKPEYKTVAIVEKVLVICFLPSTYPIIRTGFSEIKGWMPIIEDILRATGS